MKKYLDKLKQVSAPLERFQIKLVLRAENAMPDTLAKLASSKEIDLKRSAMIDILQRWSTYEKGKEIMVNKVGK